MMIAFPAALAMAHQCAPGIAPEALLSIVSVESGFDPLAINVNHVGRFRADTAVEAVTIATQWISAGYSVDLGLAQVNSNNLGWSGLSVADAFDPCANLTAAEKILQLSYAEASRGTKGIDAISRTFSLYNSGNQITGFRNNYVERVWRASATIVARIEGGPTSAGPEAPDDDQIAPTPISPSFVVGPADGSVMVFK
jgi:type IV secretion system protein VirB1